MSSYILSATFSDNTKGKSAHYHDCHQILYIKKGEAYFNINGNEHIATDNCIIIISRFEEHSIRINSEKYERYNLRISPVLKSEDETSQHLLSVLVNRPQNFRHIVKTDDSERFERIFSLICRENSAKTEMSDYMLNLLFGELLILIKREHPELFAVLSDNSVNTVSAIKRSFETNYKYTYTLDELASRYHISKSHLSHQFKSITGNSVMGYLLSCRIAAAKRELAKSDTSISEIVEQCGFSDFSNFSRTFKTFVGISPSDFRKQYRD